jgi:hypothetical protein
MSDTTPALDEAFERMAAASFELPNGFVNHGAMACEALAMLDCTDDIDSWARRFARAGGASVDPVVPAGFEWRQALGDYQPAPGVDRLLHPGHRRRRLAGCGRDVGAAADARAAHRAVPRRHPDRPCRAGHDAVDTRRGAASWPGRWVTGRPATATGQPASPLPPAGDLRMAVVRAAADGARRYLARPGIVHLHGVTGAMAVEILAAHIPATDGAAALAQVHAEHAALYAATEPVTQPHPARPPGSELTVAAVRSLDPHQVKLVEACRRGHAATGDPAFAAAAETVTGLRLTGNRRPA